MTTATNEINLQDLENITGGKITAEGEKKLVAGLKLAKATGVSKAQVLELLPQYYDALHSQFPETSLKEVKDYINKNWNKI